MNIGGPRGRRERERAKERERDKLFVLHIAARQFKVLHSKSVKTSGKGKWKMDIKTTTTDVY